MMKVYQWLCAALIMSLSTGAQAQDEDWDNDWGDDETKPYTLSGFIEAGFGQFLQTNIVKNDQSLAELRARIDGVYEFADFTINAKGDLISDKVSSGLDWSTRELNIGGSLTSAIDFKIGRQVLTWGTGDYLFLNDQFAKDWQSFFSGREDEYLKSYADSAKVSYFWRDLGIDFIWTPTFQPDTYLTGERFSFYSPVANSQVAPDERFLVNTNDGDTFAMRFFMPLMGFDTAVYLNKGYWTTPNAIGAGGIPYFAELSSLGASLQGPVANGLFKFEWSYYRSDEDKSGSNSSIPNNQVRYLIGYEQEVMTNLTFSVQGYVEKTKQYTQLIENSQFPIFEQKEHRTLITNRLSYQAMQQKLRLSLFTFYSPSDNDWYMRPSVNYRMNDSWSFSFGGNLFNGNQIHSFFGQHRENSNLYFRIRLNM